MGKKILILSIMAMIIIMPLVGAVNVTKSSKDNANLSDKIVSNEDFTHTVLAEYASKSTCPHCPASSGAVIVSKTNNNGYTNITVHEAYQMLTCLCDGIQIPVDVRTDDEWNEERIDTPEPEDPVHYANLHLGVGLQEFMTQYEGEEIILYCKTGGRSSTAASLLVANGFNGTIYNMLGGINAWNDAGYPTPIVRSHSLSFPASHPILNRILNLQRLTTMFSIFSFIFN